MCRGCGTLPSDWLTENGRIANPAPFEHEVIKCYGCEALDDGRSDHEKTKPPPSPGEDAPQDTSQKHTLRRPRPTGTDD